MKRNSTLFLQVVIVLFGLGVFALMLWMPTQEGVNANATFSQIYFDDPLLAFVYLGSIPFYVSLFQAVKVLSYVGNNHIFSQPAVNAVQLIKHCAFLLASAIVAVDAFILTNAHPDDDPAGALMLGMIATALSVVVGIAAAVIQKTLQKAVDLKSENDLTV